MTNQPLRVLVIGAGSRGRAYTRALKHLDYIRVTGIAEPNVVRRRKLKKSCVEDFPTVEIDEYDDWKDALQQTDNYDGVLICVLDDMHRDIAIAFADAGKHLLCEKPLATTWDDCQSIVEAVKRNNVLLAVGHVLRYSPHNVALKKLVDDGAVGDIININHTEPVGWYHFAHSYVRGNWRRADTTTFSLMAKCCHDLDVLMWFLGAENLKRVSSFGSLSHFKKENKPKEAGDATYCMSCPYEEQCGYSAKKIYLEEFLAGRKAWKTKTLTDIEDAPHLIKALEEGPYGRCVYETDNDVCDNQVVNLDFGHATATMTMVAFSEEVCYRKMCIYGSKGEISTDSRTIRLFDFATKETTTITPPEDQQSGHGGGDAGLATAFAQALNAIVNGGSSVENATGSYIGCTPDDILASHKVVFLSEQARLNSTVVGTSDRITI
jgi:predicted dehydrogenase